MRPGRTSLIVLPLAALALLLFQDSARAQRRPGGAIGNPGGAIDNPGGGLGNPGGVPVIARTWHCPRCMKPLGRGEVPSPGQNHCGPVTVDGSSPPADPLPADPANPSLNDSPQVTADE